MDHNLCIWHCYFVITGSFSNQLYMCWKHSSIQIWKRVTGRNRCPMTLVQGRSKVIQGTQMAHFPTDDMSHEGNVEIIHKLQIQKIQNGAAVAIKLRYHGGCLGLLSWLRVLCVFVMWRHTRVTGFCTLMRFTSLLKVCHERKTLYKLNRIRVKVKWTQDRSCELIIPDNLFYI